MYICKKAAQRKKENKLVFMKTSDLFEESLNNIPYNQRCKLDLSFAISDKIARTLQEKGMSKIDLANKIHLLSLFGYINRNHFAMKRKINWQTI